MSREPSMLPSPTCNWIMSTSTWYTGLWLGNGAMTSFPRKMGSMSWRTLTSWTYVHACHPFGPMSPNTDRMVADIQSHGEIAVHRQDQSHWRFKLLQGRDGTFGPEHLGRAGRTPAWRSSLAAAAFLCRLAQIKGYPCHSLLSLWQPKRDLLLKSPDWQTDWRAGIGRNREEVQ